MDIPTDLVEVVGKDEASHAVSDYARPDFKKTKATSSTDKYAFDNPQTVGAAASPDLNDPQTSSTDKYVFDNPRTIGATASPDLSDPQTIGAAASLNVGEGASGIPNWGGEE